MPFVLNVDVVPPDGKVRVRHQFFGATEEECRTNFEVHAAGCAKLGPAIDEEEVEEELERIDDDEIPSYDVADDPEDEEDEEEPEAEDGEV